MPIMRERTDGIPSELVEAIERFDRETEDLIHPLRQELDSRPAPGIIYHYTTEAGLRGILGSGTLWFTDIFALNDPYEVRHGLRSAVEAFEEAITDNRPEASMLSAIFKKLATSERLSDISHIFTCSFSPNGDDLNQWRAYADNARGYAIGFDGRAFETAFMPEGNNATFHMLYDDARNTALQREIIARAVPLVSLPRGAGMTNQAITNYIGAVFDSLTLQCLVSAFFFKHEAYRSEEEYRFMELFAFDRLPPNVKTRHRNGQSIAYREFDWRGKSPGLLKQVVVGPAAATGAEDRVRSLLESAGLSAEVHASKVPYRT